MEYEKLASLKLRQIANQHQINPDILQAVLWGKAQGWSQNKIADSYNYNPNTISRYTRIVEREISKDELKELLILVGIILGAAYLIQLFNN